MLIIGVGTDYRCDDAVGLVVARWLREMKLTKVAVLEQSDEGTAIMESSKGADAAIIVDAVHSGARPGTVHRFDARAKPIPANFFRLSTHAISLAEAIELARTLNALPPHLTVFGIEGKSFEAGVGLSPEVQEAAAEVEKLVAEEVRSIMSATVGAGLAPPYSAG